MKSENMVNGGSYVINPGTEEIEKVESTLTAEQAAALESSLLDKPAPSKKKSNQGDQ